MEIVGQFSQHYKKFKITVQLLMMYVRWPITEEKLPILM